MKISELIESKIFLGVFFFAIVLISLLVAPGYQAFVNDQHLYLPVVYHTLDASLFSHDLLLTFNQSAYTLFDEVLVFLSHSGLPMEWILLALSIIARLLLFSGVYTLARLFSAPKWLAFLTVVVIVPLQYIYGTKMVSWDLYLTPRLMAMALGFWSIILWQWKKKWLALLAFVSALAIHSITAVQAAAIIALTYLFIWLRRGNIKLKYIILAVVVLIGTMLAFKLQHFDTQWYQIIAERDPYIFFLTWPKSAYFYLLVDGVVLGLLIYKLKAFVVGDLQRLLLSLAITPLFLTLVSIIYSDILRIALIGQVQLMRSLVWWRYLLPLAVLLWIYHHGLERMKATERLLWTSYLVSFFTLEPLRFISSIGLILYFIPWSLFQIQTKASLIGLSAFISGVVAFVVAKVSHLALWEAVQMILAVSLVWFVLYLRKKDLYFISLFVVGLCFYCLRVQIWLNPTFSWSVASLPYYNLCQIIDEKVPAAETIFVWPATSDGGVLRLGCLHSVFVSKSDGAQVVFDREYAIEWQRRMMQAEQWQANEQGMNFLRSQNIHYILTSADLSLEEVIRLEGFKLYSL